MNAQPEALPLRANPSPLNPPQRIQIAPVLFLVFMLVFMVSARAQDLEPRAFSPAPVGMNVVVIGYGYSEGNVFFDSALPVEDATGQLHSATFGAVRTLGLFGSTAKIGAVIPYVWGDWEGLWLGEPASTSRRGFADPALSLAVNFIGSPARSLKEFARTYREGTIVGAALLAITPLGQYDPEKLINLGTNRWAFRWRLGVSHRTGHWTLEAIGEVWTFTENSEAFGGNTIVQDPILAIQLNGIYQFKAGFWLGAGFGYGEGGQTTVSGQEKDTRQINKRWGAVLVYPLNRRNSLKLNYLSSLSTRIGADFDRLGLFWQYRWGGGL